MSQFLLELGSKKSKFAEFLVKTIDKHPFYFLKCKYSCTEGIGLSRLLRSTAESQGQCSPWLSTFPGVKSEWKMEELAGVLERVSQTSRTGEKTALVSDYLRRLNYRELSLAALYLSGRLLPHGAPFKLNVGWKLILDSLDKLNRLIDDSFGETYRRFGDLGQTAWFLLHDRGVLPSFSSLALSELADELEKIALISGKSSRKEKDIRLEEIFRRLSPLGLKYLIRLLLGDLRVGLKESLVEKAIALAFSEPLSSIRRANLLLSDIGEVALLAQAQKTREASLRPLRPLHFMLADTLLDTAEPFRKGSGLLLAEDKYDGIRAQLHYYKGEVAIFSRNLEKIGPHFPEIEESAKAWGHDLILDGEIISLKDEVAQPFSLLQQRLHRKKVERWKEVVPVSYIAFDLLYLDGTSLLGSPLESRQALLRGLSWPPGFQMVHQIEVGTEQELRCAFNNARERGNEGLMLKEIRSLYSPGSRGKQWLKFKKELTTLDCLIVTVEWGHGKRAGLLSDYTFAVKGHGGDLLTIGKAYSGLTDREIKSMTAWFLEHCLQDEGWRLQVEPKIVVEIAFNQIQRSPRHTSGFALRFPRIKRIRDDKLPEEIDTIETVEKFFLKEKRDHEDRGVCGVQGAD